MDKKLTPEELEKFQQNRLESSRLYTALADLTYRQTFLQFELDAVKDAIKQNANNQQVIAQEISGKYGDVSINVEDGTLTSLETNQAEESPVAE